MYKGKVPMYDAVPQAQYAANLQNNAYMMKDLVKRGQIPPEEVAKFQKFKDRPESYDQGVKESNMRKALATLLMKRMVENMVKAGVTTALGYNFYDLRPPVLLAFPVNTPLRNELPRIGKVNAGVGTSANWKATRVVGSPYVGAVEGQRVGLGTPDENDYIALYKELGVERGVTLTAQYAGEGYADNVADEHLRGFFSLALGEEGMIINGNPGTGTGQNGFALTTCPTPTLTRNTVSTGGFGSTTSVSIVCVALTAMGNPSTPQYGYQAAPTVAGGLTPFYVRDNYDGSQTQVNGGMSIPSAQSSVVSCDSTHQTATATFSASLLPIKGAFGYAWYVNVTDASTPSNANYYLAAITQFPTYTVTAAPTGTQTLAQLLTNGANVDRSYQTTDFTGLLGYSATTAGATYTDLYGAGFTSQKNGRVTEVETLLQTIWNSYQAGIDQIIGSVDAVAALDAAVRYSGTSSSSYRFDYVRDEQGNLLGGFVVSGYQSRYTMLPNGYSIPIRIHPMMPAGTLYFDLRNVPYTHSRAPFARGLMVQRDYYSIEWPMVTRQWTFGTYVHEVLAETFPWIPGVLTGIGPFTQSN